MSKVQLDNKSKEEILQTREFLRTIRSDSIVYLQLTSTLDNLEADIDKPLFVEEEKNKIGNSSVNDKDTMSRVVQNIVILIHKKMYEEGFICYVEKASSVPGFAGTIRGNDLTL